MPRYLIFGNESRKAIERTVTEVLAEKGLKVYEKLHYRKHLYWNGFVTFCMYPQDVVAANSAGLWVELKTRDRRRRPIKQIIEPPQKTKIPVNYEIAISPTGYGSAVERGAEYRAGQLDQLCEALVPHLKDAQVYKSCGICGINFQLME